MKSSAVCMNVFRTSFKQATPSAATSNFFTAAPPDRVITRSATMLAVFGIALSSFSLKQMLANSGNKQSAVIPLRKTLN